MNGATYPLCAPAAGARLRWLETQIVRVDTALNKGVTERLESARARLQAEYDILSRAADILEALRPQPLCVGCGKISHYSKESAALHAQALMVIGDPYQYGLNLYRCNHHLRHWHTGHARSPQYPVRAPWGDPTFLAVPLDVWVGGQVAERGSDVIASARGA